MAAIDLQQSVRMISGRAWVPGATNAGSGEDVARDATWMWNAR